MLIERWQARRSEAVAMLALAVRQGKVDGEELDALAGVIHRIAGTAGMFGEQVLGERAAQLEYALRHETTSEERLRLAEELLAAA